MRRRKLLACTAAMGWPMAAMRVRAAAPLRVGLTAVILADQAAFLSRWSEYLSERVGTAVVFVTRESYQSILDLLFAGQLDAAWICGYPYVRHQSQLRLLAVPLYQGRPLYQSYLIRNHAASDVSGWASLKNHVLAYSDPLSNSGWLVAQAQLRGAGLNPHDLKRTFFAHGHRNVAEAVATGLAQAGCIDGYVWETMRLQNMASIAQTQVVWKSDFYAFPPLVARQADRNRLLRTLETALLDMHNDSEGQGLLRSLNLNGFSTAAPALFEPIRLMASSLAARP